MTAAAAPFLYLLPLAAAPIVFHLLMRRRQKQMVFSTLMFFHRTDPKLQSRRKLREWLLLAARMLLIALTLLALARLTVKMPSGGLALGGNQAVVVLIDNSGSMTAPAVGSARTKLQAAIDSARTLVGSLDAKALAGAVMLVDDPAIGVGETMSADKKATADAIDRIRPTESTGDGVAAMARAMDLFERFSPSGGAIHVFTDLQEAEWMHRRIDPTCVRPGVDIVFHRVITKALDSANVSVCDIQAPRRRILPGQPYLVNVVMRNQGPGRAAVRLNSEDDQRHVGAQTVEIEPAQEKTLSVLVRPEAAGYHWVKVWVEGDSFQADNHAALAYFCQEKAPVLLVGGREEFGVLPVALSPHGDGRYTSLVPAYCRLDELQARADKAKPILIVLTWRDAQGLAGGGLDAWLRQYVEAGGNLLLTPSTQAKPIGGSAPAWLGGQPAAAQEFPTSVPLQVLDKSSPFWSDLRGPDGRVRLGTVYARRLQALRLDSNAERKPLLGLGYAKVVLAAGMQGKGTVFLSGTAFDRNWNSLPQMKPFVALAQIIALGGGPPAQSDAVLVAGTAARLRSTSQDPVRILSLVGDPMDWAGPAGRTPVFARSGAFTVQAGVDRSCLSVRSSDQEGSSGFIQGGAVPAMGSTPHRVSTLADAESFQADLALARAGVELYLPLLLMALMTLAVEGWLGLPRRREGDAASGKVVPRFSADQAAQEGGRRP
ncbi:MAG: hypothetical protein BWX88_02294 [Planctomycetes bacterium ADurb.Bin126]|nr:MAG: hypothetical protein BWX88_02294 [Planctomycetes bacterium ADurb.Bin126]HOD81350.1 BatA and WFA domain-containing protein [Phycisphaerae bacterium]HQL73791.1 BatA and WFA domain-containing protein [Phycisphaerae bacterium]